LNIRILINFCTSIYTPSQNQVFGRAASALRASRRAIRYITRITASRFCGWFRFYPSRSDLKAALLFFFAQKTLLSEKKRILAQFNYYIGNNNMKKIISILAIAAFVVSANGLFAQKSNAKTPAKSNTPTATVLLANPSLSELSKKEAKAVNKKATDKAQGKLQSSTGRELQWTVMYNKAEKRITAIEYNSGTPQSEAFWNIQKSKINAEVFKAMETCLQKDDASNYEPCIGATLQSKTR
jgi:hypothetical protein